VVDGVHTEWLNMRQAQAILGLSRASIQRYITAKLLTVRQDSPGGWCRFKLEWLEQFIASRTVPARPVLPHSRRPVAGAIHNSAELRARLRSSSGIPRRTCRDLSGRGLSKQ